MAIYKMDILPHFFYLHQTLPIALHSGPSFARYDLAYYGISGRIFRAGLRYDILVMRKTDEDTGYQKCAIYTRSIHFFLASFSLDLELLNGEYRMCWF